MPVATGIALLLAGCVQLTAWKARKLGRCREACGPDAWQHGLRLGINCVYCCTSFMIVLLVTGVMDLAAMAIVAVAITVERLAPRPQRVARPFGVALIAAGAVVSAMGVTRY